MRYLSTFTGIGGFEIGIYNAYRSKERREQENSQGISKDGARLFTEAGKDTGKTDRRVSERSTNWTDKRPLCIGYSEVDSHAIKTYEEHYEHHNYGDITAINAESLPDFDLIVGGFPCQAFSVAGKRKGFDETRGTLFFDLARILKHKRPGHFVFENVKGLLSHDGGKTIQTIAGVLSDLGYRIEWQVLNSKDFGVPQNRERIYIVGHLRERCGRQVLPIVGENSTTLEPGVSLIEDSARHEPRVYTDFAPTVQSSYGMGGGHVPYVADTINRGAFKTTGDNALTLTASYYKGHDNHGARPMVQVREATKKGYAEATIGDTINISMPTSKTRRGRVQRGLAGTLQTGESMVTPVAFNRKDGIGKELEVSGTLSSSDWRGLNRNQTQTAVQDGVRIRRLTPTECERLQGFPDGWTIGSDTQRYKQCGNAVTTNVVEAVMLRLKECM